MRTNFFLHKLFEHPKGSRGHPGNPMGWDALGTKFRALAEPVLGARAGPLLRVLREFDRPGAMAEAFRLTDGRPAGAADSQRGS